MKLVDLETRNRYTCLQGNKEDENLSDILMLFKEYLEKQDVLTKLIEENNSYDYGYSEIHTISAIEDLNEANVTNISEYLKITKGAVSKITKKLISKELIKSYKVSNNKQKVFFELTDKGKIIYHEHKKRHDLWLKRDDEFFKQFSKDDINTICDFMVRYNNHLNNKINNIEEE